MSKKPHKKTGKISSDELLSSFESITIKLENGKEVKLDMEDEICVPTDPAALVRAHRRSPARLAFWSAQTDRAMLAVRKLEQNLADIEGQADMVARLHVHEDTEFPVTERAVQSYVDQRAEVKTARIRMRNARKHFDLLRTMRSAMDHRCFVLGRIYSAQEVKATRD